MFAYLKRKYNNLVSDTSFSEILTGSIWALSARVIAVVLGLGFSVIVARIYGAEVVGIVAVINSFLMIVTIFTVLGTPTSILRLIPEHLTKYSTTSAFRVYRKTQYMVIGVSLLTGILFFLSAKQIADKLFSKPDLADYFALASGFIIFRSLMLLNTEAVRGLRMIRMFALMQVLPQSFNLIFLFSVGFLWPAKNVPVYAVLGGFGMTGILGWMIMEYSFRKMRRPDDLIQPMYIRQIIGISLPMLMATSMDIIISRIGLILLGIFRSEAEVGYFDIAVKLAGLTTIILGAVNSLIAPRFSQLFHSGKIDELFYIAKKSAKLIFWTTTPILIVFAVLGKPILSVFFGNSFSAAYFSLLIMVSGKFVSSISGSTGIFMNMTGNQSVFKNIMLVAALICIIGNLLLIPMFGINGAAFATMISLSFWNIATLVYIRIKYRNTTGYFPVVSSYQHEFHQPLKKFLNNDYR